MKKIVAAIILATATVSSAFAKDYNGIYDINIDDKKNFEFYSMWDDDPTPWFKPKDGKDLIDLSQIDCQWSNGKKTKCHNSLSPQQNFPKDGIAVQSEIVRSGKVAWKFKNGQGDCGFRGDGKSDCDSNRERSEVSMLTWPSTGVKWFKVSMYIPKESAFDFGISNGVWQIHSKGANVDFMMRVGLAGELKWVDWHNGDWFMKETKMLDAKDFRDKWIDFVLKIDFQNTKQGSVKIWANNKKVVDYTGRTQFVSTDQQYMKFGIYKSNIDRYSGPDRGDSIVYYDAIAIGDSCKELKLENEDNSCEKLK